MDFSGIKFKEITTNIYNGKEYRDIVFSLEGQTQQDFDKYYAEMGLRGVSEILYGLDDHLIGIKIIRVFDSYVITEDIPEGLEQYLADACKEKK